jgi:hypothetical protein
VEWWHVLRCRLLGHRYRFASVAEAMLWQCERGCGANGCKRYPTPENARRYANAFDRQDRDTLGRRAPAGLTPLRLWRLVRRRRSGA